MRTILEAVGHIDYNTICSLAQQAGGVIVKEEWVSSTLVRVSEDLAAVAVTPKMAAMAGLALGYAIARHEIGEELMGGGGEDDQR